MAPFAQRSRYFVPHSCALAFSGMVSPTGKRPRPRRRPPCKSHAIKELSGRWPANKDCASRRKFMPPAKFPLHQRIAMSRKVHPWGVPPWTVAFRPAPCALPDQVDFAIIGGGFTGLSTAAWLRRFAPGRSVLVLEAASLGDGASGRTGGMAPPETAAGQLPGLGDGLAGYKKILRAFPIASRLMLPGLCALAPPPPPPSPSP